MALMSYVQRRHSGSCESRKRLRQTFAGKNVPAPLRASFSGLINCSTGKFKHELVQPLDTRGCRQEARLSDCPEARRNG